MSRGKNKYKQEVIIADNIGEGRNVLADDQLEQIVLGAVLLESGTIDSLAGLFSEALFYSEKHQIIVGAVMELFDKNEKIDIITVTRQLMFRGQLEYIGGAYYITTLTNRVASSSNTEYHVRILQQMALARSLNDICNKTRYKLFSDDNDIFDVCEEMQSSIEGSLKGIAKYQVSKVSDIHEKIIQKSRDLLVSGGSSGVPSGLYDLDNVTNGWQKSDLVIVAGRPGMGKTAFALCVMLYPTLMQNRPIAFFSLEMSSEQLVGRMQSAISMVNASRIVKKQLTVEEIDYIEQKAKDLSTAPIFIDDTPNISLMELKTKARKLVREDKVEMIIVDYLQLMRSGLNVQNREQEIAEISRGLKSLAKELDIPVIALSQLSRSVESRGGDKKPMLSDLRESGQIEQDADMVIFCYRPEYYGIEMYQYGTVELPCKGLFISIIAKHRSGATGEVKLGFMEEQIRITNYGSEIFAEQNKSNTFVDSKENGSLSSNLIVSTDVLQMEADFLNDKSGLSNTIIDNNPGEDHPF